MSIGIAIVNKESFLKKFLDVDPETPCGFRLHDEASSTSWLDELARRAGARIRGV